MTFQQSPLPPPPPPASNHHTPLGGIPRGIQVVTDDFDDLNVRSNQRPPLVHQAGRQNAPLRPPQGHPGQRSGGGHSANSRTPLAPSYEGWVLTKGPSTVGKTPWSSVVRKSIDPLEEDLESEVWQSKRKGKGPTHAYEQMDKNKNRRKHIDQLVNDRTREEPAWEFQLALVAIKQRRTRDGIETVRMRVILRRVPRADDVHTVDLSSADRLGPSSVSRPPTYAEEQRRVLREEEGRTPADRRVHASPEGRGPWLQPGGGPANLLRPGLATPASAMSPDERPNTGVFPDLPPQPAGPAFGSTGPLPGPRLPHPDPAFGQIDPRPGLQPQRPGPASGSIDPSPGPRLQRPHAELGSVDPLHGLKPPHPGPAFGQFDPSPGLGLRQPGPAPGANPLFNPPRDGGRAFPQGSFGTQMNEETTRAAMSKGMNPIGETNKFRNAQEEEENSSSSPESDDSESGSGKSAISGAWTDRTPDTEQSYRGSKEYRKEKRYSKPHKATRRPSSAEHDPEHGNHSKGEHRSSREPARYRRDHHHHSRSPTDRHGTEGTFRQHRRKSPPQSPTSSHSSLYYVTDDDVEVVPNRSSRLGGRPSQSRHTSYPAPKERPILHQHAESYDRHIPRSAPRPLTNRGQPTASFSVPSDDYDATRQEFRKELDEIKQKAAQDRIDSLVRENEHLRQKDILRERDNKDRDRFDWPSASGYGEPRFAEPAFPERQYPLQYPYPPPQHPAAGGRSRRRRWSQQAAALNQPFPPPPPLPPFYGNF